jgi:hypothetical protein
MFTRIGGLPLPQIHHTSAIRTDSPLRLLIVASVFIRTEEDKSILPGM